MKFIYNFGNFIQKIDEGLIKTYPIDKVLFYIKNNIGIFNLKYSTIVNDNNTFTFVLDDFDKIQLIEECLDMILLPIYNTYGWFPSTMEILKTNDISNNMKFDKEYLLANHVYIKEIKITFESKFDKVVEIPEKMYHLTILSYKDSILKNGLVTKSKSKLNSDNNDGRIYLSDNPELCYQLTNKMKFHYNNERDMIIHHPKNTKRIYNKDTGWIIFEIDSKSAGINKLYKDPNSEGFYCINYINPESIKIYDEEK